MTCNFLIGHTKACMHLIGHTNCPINPPKLKELMNYSRDNMVQYNKHIISNIILASLLRFVSCF